MTSKPNRPLRRTSLGEDVAGRLRQAIIAAQLTPGTPLREPNLAKQFGVSRAPVRDALVQLERERLVEFSGTGRTQVRILTHQDFHEVVTLRSALESLAAREATRRWRAADTEWVTANVRAQQAAGTIGKLNKLDLDLHEYIITSSGHGRLLDAWRTLRPQMEVWLGHMFRLQRKLRIDSRETTTNAHHELLAAIASGDAERAVRVSTSHVDSWRLWIEATSELANQGSAEA